MAKKAARRKTPDAPVIVEDVAVLEPVKKEPVEQSPWRMPEVQRGQVVKIYPRGSLSERYSGVAFVVSTGQMSIDCVYMNNAYQDCLHVDDPRLKENREDVLADAGGIWDFAPETDLEKKVKELEERIQRLEG